MSVLKRELPYVNAFGTVDISNSKNISEALENAGMNWDVKSKTLYDENGRVFEGFRANIREDNEDLLGIVSSSYTIVQNAEAFQFLDELANNEFTFDSAGVFRNGKSSWIMGKLPQEQVLGDDVDNNIVFINSHDGSSGVKVLMTPVRVICNNMLNVATKRAKRSWAAKHTKHIINRIDEAKYTLGLANNYIESLKIFADELSMKKVTEAQIESIFDIMFPIDPNKDTERKIKNVSIMKDNLFACYNESDIAKFKGTAWGAINAMSDVISHADPARITEAFYNNKWNKLVNGHPVLDDFVTKISK